MTLTEPMRPAPLLDSHSAQETTRIILPTLTRFAHPQVRRRRQVRPQLRHLRRLRHLLRPRRPLRHLRPLRLLAFRDRSWSVRLTVAVAAPRPAARPTRTITLNSSIIVRSQYL